MKKEHKAHDDYFCDLCGKEMIYDDMKKNEIKNREIKITYFNYGFCYTGYDPHGVASYPSSISDVIKHICVECMTDIRTDFLSKYLEYRQIKNILINNKRLHEKVKRILRKQGKNKK